MSQWLAVIAPFLLGAATGGWWSRRRAVATAVASALSVAHAQALAQGGHVYIGTSGPRGWNADELAGLAAQQLGASPGDDDYYDFAGNDDYDFNYNRAGASVRPGGDGVRRGRPGDAPVHPRRGVRDLGSDVVDGPHGIVGRLQ